METKILSVRLTIREVEAVKFLRLKKISLGYITRLGLIETIRDYENKNPLDKFVPGQKEEK